MIGYKELREELTREGVHGQVEGVRVGQKFQNRGELAIMGLHCMISAGIYAKCVVPCFICARSTGTDLLSFCVGRSC